MSQTLAWILYAVCVLIALSPIGWIAYKWMTWEGEKLPLSMPDEEYRAKIAIGEGVSNSQKENEV